MELPAESWAIEQQQRQMDARYGDGIALASMELSLHPTDPEAHRRYAEEIGLMLKRLRSEHE